MRTDNKTPLTPEEEKELELLNLAIKLALKNRNDWLDKKMHEHSLFKIGDIIAERETGRILGTITSLYRYPALTSTEGIDDNTLSIDYEFKVIGNGHFFDNTSRQPFLSIKKTEL